MEPTLSTTETAALAGTTRFTVAREIERGNLVARKTAGRWIIAENDARRWAAQFRPHEGLRKRA